MRPLLICSGEPAGIGPDICLALARCRWPLVVVADKSILMARAQQLKIKLVIHDYQRGQPPVVSPHHLTVVSIPCKEPPVPGVLNIQNAAYVMNMLTLSTDRCLTGEFSAFITAPVHKGVLNQAGYAFTGHTEFLAKRSQVKTVVMMLACQSMRVALVTTHIPLKDVPSAITSTLLMDVVKVLHQALQQDFAIAKPRVYLAGLNPHAGEGGYLGREEIDVIKPTILKLRDLGLDIQGPFSADTMFNPKHLQACDALVAMYHDQGLPVIKYADFGRTVNVTLGLPFIRTSVDHGTALDIAGKGLAEPTSLIAAVDMAAHMVDARAK